MYLMSVLGPTTEILFFACPKKSIQKKRHPNAALILRAEAFAEGFRKGFPSPSENERHPCRSPNGLFSPKAPVLGAAYGITPLSNPKLLITHQKSKQSPLPPGEG
jgi:hypothetical protein